MQERARSNTLASKPRRGSHSLPRARRSNGLARFRLHVLIGVLEITDGHRAAGCLGFYVGVISEGSIRTTWWKEVWLANNVAAAIALVRTFGSSSRLCVAAADFLGGCLQNVCDCVSIGRTHATRDGTAGCPESETKDRASKQGQGYPMDQGILTESSVGVRKHRKGTSHGIVGVIQSLYVYLAGRFSYAGTKAAHPCYNARRRHRVQLQTNLTDVDVARPEFVSLMFSSSTL